MYTMCPEGFSVTLRVVAFERHRNGQVNNTDSFYTRVFVSPYLPSPCGVFVSPYLPSPCGVFVSPYLPSPCSVSDAYHLSSLPWE
ncbi:hypothetical protein BaRGS_00004962 [Batillaria attramentaria]|uniref:Uncharacterized protein n=1 Tax=Batillaria attramentaria TaxID=370345 RepID=A0ABD0LW10_9CAEN